MTSGIGIFVEKNMLRNQYIDIFFVRSRLILSWSVSTATPGGVRGWAYSPAMDFKLVWSLVDHTQSLDHPYYILIPAHAIERKDCRLKVIYCYWIGFPVPPLDSLPGHKRWPVQATGSLLLGVSGRVILIDSWKITLCQVFT